MIASMTLMLGAIIWGIVGRDSAVRIASCGIVATTVGAVSGAILLLFSPILTQCLILSAYLAVTIMLYTFGFGSGFADKARFIRRSASIQKR